jgi:hypothetical protein
MTTQSKVVKTVELDNGKTAVSFVAESNRPLAVVDLGVLQKLAQLLAPANYEYIRMQLIAKLKDTHTITGYVEVLEEELAFQTSVNLITVYKPETTE